MEKKYHEKNTTIATAIKPKKYLVNVFIAASLGNALFCISFSLFIKSIKLFEKGPKETNKYIILICFKWIFRSSPLMKLHYNPSYETQMKKVTYSTMAPRLFFF